MEHLGCMTNAGRAVLPDMSPNGFTIDADIEKALKAESIVWENFQKFPPLYQRVRIYTIQIKKKQPELFQSKLKKLIENMLHFKKILSQLKILGTRWNIFTCALHSITILPGKTEKERINEIGEMLHTVWSEFWCFQHTERDCHSSGNLWVFKVFEGLPF